jgi:hypothetical protein
MKGLVAYYQPPLTEEDIKAGHVRPDRVVGSYAIYHEQPQATYVDGKNYRSGKAFHLYRPELIDANGQRTWAEQKLDTDAGTLTITMDREWLDRAVYPVVVDPTLGYTTQGGSFFGDPDYRDSSHATTGASGGTMSELHAFVKNGAATEYGIKVAVYTDDAGNNRPEDQVASEIEFRIPASSAVAERSGSYSGSLAASTKYWLAFIPEDISVQVAYDNSAANSECYLYPNPSGYDLPANWGNSGAGYTARYSIWAVYAAAGGRTTKNTRSHGLGLRLGLSRGMPQGVA